MATTPETRRTTMSDNEQADNNDMPVTARLWSVVEELQNVRQQNEIDRREGQNSPQ